MKNENHFDAIVIGGGPAGLTAGIYLSRAKAKTLIINEGALGGQMVLTHEIANYPGVENISGYQLANIMKKQAKTFGCILKSNITIKEINFDSFIKYVVLETGEKFTSNSIILTPGGRSRTLNIEGEAKFKGRGISYCATCDGDFFTNKEIIVVGGGNSALEEAVSLTKYASKVTIIHQFDYFQAFQHAIDEAKINSKIDFIMNSVIIKFNGEDKIESVDVKNVNTDNITNIKIDGVFVFIGYIPNTEFLKNKIELNQWGEIITKNDMSTNIIGVYAAGDSISKKIRQITTAVGDGTVAALSVSNYLHENKIL